MKIENLQHNYQILQSLNDCPVFAIKYAAKRTIDRVEKEIKEVAKLEKENMPGLLVELEKEKDLMKMKSGSQDVFSRKMQAWAHLEQYFTLLDEFTNSDEQKQLMQQDSAVQVFTHSFKEEYLDNWNPDMNQIAALEIICPNFNEVMDKKFS